MQRPVMVILQKIELHFGPIHVPIHVHDEGYNIEEYQHHENPLRALLWDMRGQAIAKDIDRYPTHYFACYFVT